MKGEYRKIIFSVVVLTLFLVAPVVLAQEIDTSILESEKSALEEEVAQLEDKIASYQNDLSVKHEEVVSLKNQISIINTRISKLNTEIRATEDRISITELNIKQTEVEIDTAISTIEKNKSTLAELLRNFYELDNESLLERMLKYNNLSEVLSETEYLGTLQERLTLTLNETREAKSDLESHKATLDSNKKDLEQKNRQLGLQKNAEKSEQSHKNTILSQTQQEEKRYQDLLTEAETERADFMKKIADIEEQILIQQNFLTYFKAGETPPPGTRIFIWPEENPIVTQNFGYTSYAKRGAYGGQGHNGLDMTSGLASIVKAAAGGEVIAKGSQTCTDYISRSCNGFWGNWIAIKHPGGLVTLYAHLTKPSTLAEGESVAPGQIIGYEGATGNVTGPHLHFSVYTEFFTYNDPQTGVVRFSYNFGKTINPLDYL